MIFNIFLTLHITGGAVGLFTGTWNLVSRKGDKGHRLRGKWFVRGMLTAGASALALSVMHPSPFLFIVGIFTLYLVGTGTRILKLKKLGKSQRPLVIDWILLIGMILSGFVFVGWGLWMLYRGISFGFVLLVFGGIGLRMAFADLQLYKRERPPVNFWLLTHIQRMTAGYIASLTAFLVVNAKFIPLSIPGIVYWLLPTVVITPLIIKWSGKYSVKKKKV